MFSLFVTTWEKLVQGSYLQTLPLSQRNPFSPAKPYQGNASRVRKRRLEFESSTSRKPRKPRKTQERRLASHTRHATIKVPLIQPRKEPCRFLDLPLELRFMIYRISLGVVGVLAPCTPKQDRHPADYSGPAPDLAWLMVNQQIRREAKECLIKYNIWRITDGMNGDQWCDWL